jgi:hypothetical protein
MDVISGVLSRTAGYKSLSPQTIAAYPASRLTCARSGRIEFLRLLTAQAEQNCIFARSNGWLRRPGQPVAVSICSIQQLWSPGKQLRTWAYGKKLITPVVHPIPWKRDVRKPHPVRSHYVSNMDTSYLTPLFLTRLTSNLRVDSSPYHV